MRLCGLMSFVAFCCRLLRFLAFFVCFLCVVMHVVVLCRVLLCVCSV